MVVVDAEAGPPAERLDAALESAVAAACAAEASRARAEALRAELIEAARSAAVAVPSALVAAGVRGRVEREEAARRALVAEIATGMRVSEAHAASLIDESRLLVNELPATLTGLREAMLSPEHAREVVRAALAVPAEARGRFDEQAVALAAASTPPQLRYRLRALRDRLHPEASTVRHRRCVQARDMWLEDLDDGMTAVHLLLPAPEAHGVFDVVNQGARGLAAIPDEKRTIGQLRADVAVAMLLRGGAGSAEGRGAVPAGIRPRIAVTVPVLTLLGRSEEPGTLEGYGPIDPETARRLAADAPSFTRILTHPETGAVLSVGRDSYRVPADLRRHLQHRDGTCRFPGCLRTASSSDVDHGVEWQHGGRTDADNLAHLCRHHHRLRHTSTWDVEHQPEGVLQWTSPTGRRHTTRPVEPPFAGDSDSERRATP